IENQTGCPPSAAASTWIGRFTSGMMPSNAAVTSAYARGTRRTGAAWNDPYGRPAASKSTDQSTGADAGSRTAYGTTSSDSSRPAGSRMIVRMPGTVDGGSSSVTADSRALVRYQNSTVGARPAASTLHRSAP